MFFACFPFFFFPFSRGLTLERTCIQTLWWNFISCHIYANFWSSNYHKVSLVLLGEQEELYETWRYAARTVCHALWMCSARKIVNCRLSLSRPLQSLSSYACRLRLVVWSRNCILNHFYVAPPLCSITELMYNTLFYYARIVEREVDAPIWEKCNVSGFFKYVGWGRNVENILLSEHEKRR